MWDSSGAVPAAVLPGGLRAVHLQCHRLPAGGAVVLWQPMRAELLGLNNHWEHCIMIKPTNQSTVLWPQQPSVTMALWLIKPLNGRSAVTPQLTWINLLPCFTLLHLVPVCVCSLFLGVLSYLGSRALSCSRAVKIGSSDSSVPLFRLRESRTLWGFIRAPRGAYGDPILILVLYASLQQGCFLYFNVWNVLLVMFWLSLWPVSIGIVSQALSNWLSVAILFGVKHPCECSYVLKKVIHFYINHLKNSCKFWSISQWFWSCAFNKTLLSLWCFGVGLIFSGAPWITMPLLNKSIVVIQRLQPLTLEGSVPSYREMVNPLDISNHKLWLWLKFTLQTTQ